MLKIAKESNLPVIVHNRDATKDIYELLKEYNVKGIIHCFSGSVETAKEFIKLGFLIGIGGVVTFKNAKHLKEVVQNIPMSCISLETDSPYLTPEPFRKYSNEPKYIRTIGEYLANLKGVSLDEVSTQTEENIKNISKR